MLFKRLWTIAAIVILAAAFFVAGCSDSSSPTDGGGNTDTTPPGIAGVTAVDQSHVDVEFDENVSRSSAERSEYYTIVEVAPIAAVSLGASSPGDTVHIGGAVLDADGRTVHLSTWEPMQNVPYRLEVVGVSDARGNVIAAAATQSFQGTTSADVTAPTIVSRSPSPGQTNVGTGQSVDVQFSESMDYSSVLSAFSWTRPGGAVTYSVQEQGSARFLFTPLQQLQTGTTYTVSISGTAQDGAGNPLSPTSWNFTTTSQVDNTPPTLASSTPPNGATNVSVSTNLSLTFSEPVDQTSLSDVFIAPDLGSGSDSWSNGGRTVTFNPDNDMLADTQYSLLIIPGGVRDLAGNGNTSAIQIVWSTGSTLATGGFSGTITGPGSADAPTPAGATVIAADRNPFGSSDDFGVGGSGVVAGNGNYSVSNLPDGTYWPLAALDSNDDGQIDPSTGDAFGLYGVDFAQMTGEPDTVVVSGSVITGIDFDMFDPVAISGMVSYTGSVYTECCYTVYVGAFDTTGFDIDNGPDFGTEANWPNYPFYTLSEFDDGLPDGTYYVGAFLDANGNTSLDPGEPMALYGGMSPTPITLADGSDAVDIDITLTDAPGLTASSWTRPAPVTSRSAVVFRRIAELVRQAQRR